MKKNTIIGIVVVVLLVIGAIMTIKNAKKKEENMPKAQQYALVVSTMTSQVQEEFITLPYLAIVQNDKDVVLSSRVAARIEYLKPSGSNVHKGDVIARLDDAVFQSGIKSTESQITAAKTAQKNLKATHQRTLNLIKVKGASIEKSEMEESKLAELEAKVESLTQKLNTLNSNLSYTLITAPTDGKISKTMVNKGDMAMPGHPLAAVKSESGFSLLVRVPTDMNITAIYLGPKKYDAIPLNSTFHGLAEYKVYVDDDNLSSGDRIEIDVELFHGNAIKLPFDAVLNRNGKSFVLLVQNDHAVAREVDIVETGEQGIIIKNNKLAGQKIVVAKQDVLLKLLSGIALKIKED